MDVACTTAVTMRYSASALRNTAYKPCSLVVCTFPSTNSSPTTTPPMPSPSFVLEGPCVPLRVQSGEHDGAFSLVGLGHAVSQGSQLHAKALHLAGEVGYGLLWRTGRGGWLWSLVGNREGRLAMVSCGGQGGDQGQRKLHVFLSFL